MWIRWSIIGLVTICMMLQIRNFNRYRVDHRRKHDEAITYLNSDVCSDPITKSQLERLICVKRHNILFLKTRRRQLFMTF